MGHTGVSRRHLNDVPWKCWVKLTQYTNFVIIPSSSFCQENLIHQLYAGSKETHSLNKTLVHVILLASGFCDIPHNVKKLMERFFFFYQVYAKNALNRTEALTVGRLYVVTPIRSATCRGGRYLIDTACYSEAHVVAGSDVTFTYTYPNIAPIVVETPGWTGAVPSRCPGIGWVYCTLKMSFYLSIINDRDLFRLPIEFEKPHWLYH